MAFQVSPGVLVQEKDLTRVIPAVSTSIGAIAGTFNKGPLDEVVAISSEQELVDTFGKPDSTNFEYFFSAANFLQYSNALRVVRTTNTSISNANAGAGTVLISNNEDYQSNYSTGQGSVGSWAARTAGTWGNNLSVSVCDTAAAFETVAVTTVNDSATATGDTTVVLTASDGIIVGDIISFSTTAATNDYTDGHEYRVTANNTSTELVTFVRKESGTGGLHAPLTNGTNVRRRWQYYDFVDGAPSTSPYASARGGANDEMHIVVIDEDGGISGTVGEVIETYSKVSKGSDAKTSQGGTNYYSDVIFNRSAYIFWMDHSTLGATNGFGVSVASKDFNSTSAITIPVTNSLSAGANGSAVTAGQLKTAYEKFSDAETVDVGLIIGGKTPNETIGTPADGKNHVSDLLQLAEDRKDAIAFVSPPRNHVVDITNTTTITNNIINFYEDINSSSYVVFDSGYKYMYDRYNDVYRYVPLNGDMAGLAARTDLTADAWYSPAGFNRGQVRGVVKLAYNPTKAQRDQLYPKRVNPVTFFPGQGTVLFGDKTGLSAPSAFDRINVRRLFIVLEKAIATASKFQLFEFNDEFTRANFRNIVEPFLREVQGRRGITDFLVVCDETNNTGEVIDRNEFIAEIFIKPARSINFITLSFIATRTGVSFDEVAGG
jgi:phage tail sheath protein FI